MGSTSARRRYLGVAAALLPPWLAWVLWKGLFVVAVGGYSGAASPRGNPWMAVQATLTPLLPWGFVQILPNLSLSAAEVAFAVAGPLLAQLVYRMVSEDRTLRGGMRIGLAMGAWCVMSILLGPAGLLSPLYQMTQPAVSEVWPFVLGRIHVVLPYALLWLVVAAPALVWLGFRHPTPPDGEA